MKLRHATISLFAVFFLSACGSREGVTPLMEASKLGDIELVRTLLADAAEVNQTSDYGYTPLVFACWKGHIEIVKVLIDAGADVNIRTGKVPSAFETVAGQAPTTALAMAIENQNADLADLLITHGAKIDPISLAVAGKTANLSVLKKAKKQNISFNSYSGNEFEPSPLCSSIKAGHLDAVQWLCENGAEINLVLGHALPLNSAVASLKPEIVQYLLENGADPNIPTGDPNYHHSYPIGRAVMRSLRSIDESRLSIEVIELLIAHGSDVTIVDNGGGSLLDRKKVQMENGRKYRLENPTQKAEGLERRRISNDHDKVVVEVLSQSYWAQPGRR
jgi:ankyrin repeat protein